MNKTLLKRLLFELLEEIVRLDYQFQELESVLEGGLLSYLKVIRSNLTEIKNSLWQHRQDFIKLYNDTPVDEDLGENLFEGVFAKIRQELDKLGGSLYRIKKDGCRPEVDLFISSLNLNKLLPDSPRLVVLPAKGENDRDPIYLHEDLIVEYLPILSNETPLRWLGLTESFTRFFCKNSIQIKTLMDNIRISPLEKDNIVVPLLNLRMLGPAYYAYHMLNSFKTPDPLAIWVVEPVLFQELNRFGLVNKDLVIMHQSIERVRQQNLFDEPKGLTRVLGNNDELWDEILKDIEKIIPERLAFTEKLFMRSQIIEDRLSSGILISSTPMLNSPAQLREDLNNLETGGISVNKFLQQLQEFPASPMEIINSGWLHKLDCSLSWLSTALEAGPKDAFDFLQQTVLELDSNLLKSIEISEVHRVLSSCEAEAVLQV